MKWTGALCLAIILAGVVSTSGAIVQQPPDYEKILEIHLKHQDTGYSLSSLELRYGKAPNLDIKTGNLNGAILGMDGNKLKSFSIRDPAIIQGDILGPSDGDSITGYTGIPENQDATLIIPYLQDMQTLTLSDSQDGSVLVSADLTSSIALFCTDYPRDPDCLVRTATSQSSAPNPGAYLILAIVLGISVILAAGLVVLTRNRGLHEQTPSKPTVLIVDDDHEIVDLMDLLLTRKDYATIKAHSGKECLDYIRQTIPDLILLDVVMEPMDGWQTLEQIKKNPATKKIPVLMLTGKRLTATEARQYKLCIDDYIEKPFTPDDLYAAVSEILARKQKLKESLVLAKEAGVDKEKFCEFARLTHRISVNRKIVEILHVPQAVPVAADLDMLDAMSVADYINIKNRDHEKRAEQLRQEIDAALRSKGIQEFPW
jgi:DNA-binding response OmpR family regulator